MFEQISIHTLQQYWWIIISVLASALVFLLFVQGGQTFIYTIGKNENEKKIIINLLGRKWELTFTTLVTFGGAFFASFPLFYSTSFGGAYWLWIIILFCFVIQAISYEYRSKPNNFLGQELYDIFLMINGSLGTFLLGIAVASMFTGANFTVDFSNLINNNGKAISSWQSSWHGIELLSDWRNIVFGLAILFLARVLALLYFINNIDNDVIIKKSRSALIYNSVLFVLFLLSFLISIFLSNGYSYVSEGKYVFLEKYKYLKNLIEMPFIGLSFITGIILVLYGIIITLLKSSTKGIWYTGIGVFLTIFSLFITLAFNNTCYYPSKIDFQSSLTIENSSSSYYTLNIMSYVTVLIPIVVAYIYWAWKSINNKKINDEELEETEHKY